MKQYMPYLIMAGIAVGVVVLFARSPKVRGWIQGAPKAPTA